jgi:hypothetical protein
MAGPTLVDLAEFLVKAKRNTWAGDGQEVEPQRPGFKELEFKDGDWEYRDSYTGFYSAPGQEIVRFQGVPIWHMVYSGGLLRAKDYDAFKCYDTPKPIFSSEEIFNFLKEALRNVSEDHPYRGPFEYHNDHTLLFYHSEYTGEIINFVGSERIVSSDDWSGLLFKQNFMGGVITHKTSLSEKIKTL